MKVIAWKDWYQNEITYYVLSWT